MVKNWWIWGNSCSKLLWCLFCLFPFFVFSAGWPFHRVMKSSEINTTPLGYLYIYTYLYIFWSPYWCLDGRPYILWNIVCEAWSWEHLAASWSRLFGLWLPWKDNKLGTRRLNTSVSRWCTFELAAFLHSQPEGGHGKSTRRPGDGLPHLMRDPKKLIKMVIGIVVLVQLSSVDVGRCFFWSQFAKDWIDQPNNQQSECTYLKPAAAGVGYLVVNHTGLKGFWGSE